MRTAFLLGVTGGLVALGCSAPSAPAGSVSTAPRDTQLSFASPANGGNASLATKLAAVTQLKSADKVRADRVAVKFHSASPPELRAEVVDRLDLTLLSEVPELGWAVYGLPASRSLETVLDDLWQEPAVTSAEPDYRLQMNAIEVIPLDPMLGEQSYLNQTHVPEAWFLYPGDVRDAAIKANIPAVSDVTVAVLDTGFDFTHPDLNLGENGNPPDGDPRGDAVKIYGGIDLVNGDSDATDDNGHGTLIAGIIGAITDDYNFDGEPRGIAGVGFNTRLMPVKVLDENGAGDATDSAEGIFHAIQTWSDARANSPAPPVGGITIFTQPFNARLVVNMSYSFDIPNSLGEPLFERDAITYGISNGVVFVAAAGDGGRAIDDGFTTTYPAGHDQVIAVGAVDEINQLMANSNRPKTTKPLAQQRFLVAPGSNVLGTQPTSLGSDYGIGFGTSVAAAQVSGVASLMWGFYPLLLGEDALVPTLLESANEDIVGATGVDDTTGHGLLDALGALEGVFEPRPTDAPMIIRAFTDPVVHNLIHFVVLSKYKLMDPTEIPFYQDADGNFFCANPDLPFPVPEGCYAFRYRIGLDADGDGALADAERLEVDSQFFPNEIIIGQFDDKTYVGRIFFPQGPAPLPTCTPDPPTNDPTILPPPPTGDLILEVSGVPEDFRLDDTLPKSVAASTIITLTDFANS